MAKKYRVTLTAEEREELQQMISRGRGAARKLAHARVLLQVDESEQGPGNTDKQVAASLNSSVGTIEQLRRRFVEQGLAAALVPAPSRRVYPRRLDGYQEAKLIALACSQPPAGKRYWTMRLLAKRMVELQYTDSVSYETVRQVLKKTRPSRI